MQTTIEGSWDSGVILCGSKTDGDHLWLKKDVEARLQEIKERVTRKKVLDMFNIDAVFSLTYFRISAESLIA